MKKEIITHEEPKSPISEVFKTLRTNLQFMSNKDKARTLLVTSTMPGEGKSWVTANLAVAFAQSNKKVLIIDSDMRKGRVHNIFETKIFPGLSNYLSEEASIIDYLIKTDIDNLYIIPAGNVPPNPSELLSSERMVKGLEELKEEFDIIIFDSTPCMLVTDAVIISRIVDATLIVTSHKNTKIENLKEVQRNIENVGGKIAGVIINKIPVSLKKYKSKYYYYGNKNREEMTETEEQLETKSDIKKDVEETTINQISEIEDNINHVNNIEENTNNSENQKEIKNEDKDLQKQIETSQEQNDDIISQIDEYLENNK